MIAPADTGTKGARSAGREMMSLKDLVEASRRVGATTRKKEKTSLLADCLKRGRGEEIALAASYLAGQIPQGSLGIGWAILQKAVEDVAERPRPLPRLITHRRLFVSGGLP